MSYPKSPEITYTSMHNNYKPWQPGAFRRIPWSGLGCLVGAVLGMIAAIAILRASDKAPITSWRYPPTVYLSIAYTISNILLAGAFGQGVTINWWRKALQDNTQLGDLHRYWDFGQSAFSALLAGRKFNFIAFAALFIAITPVNGPLLQRSSSVEVASAYSSVRLTVPAARSIQYATARVSGRAYQVAYFSQAFNPVVQQYYTGQSISVNNSGCSANGMCSGRLMAAGLAVNCSSSTAPFDLSETIQLANGTQEINYATVNGTDVFQSLFYWSAGTPSNISLSVQYKPTKDYLNSNLVVRNCTLHPATVQYPVVVDGNRSTITLDPRSTIFDDVQIARIDYTMENSPGSDTYMGGYAYALKTRFNSVINLRWAGAVGWDTGSTGPVGAQFADQSDIADYLVDGVNLKFSDPTSYLLQQARELMFRTALAGGNTPNIQVIQSATEVQTVGIYRSHYLFLGLSLAITFIAILIVLTTYNGYWQLGRKVTMSPLETAKAFNAPLLAQEDSNAEVKDLVKGSGGKAVRYGHVLDAAGRFEANARLEIADPTSVRSMNGSRWY
ncbi:Hypothetical predicted protein [Lecanosticta acicola]|uniref:Uncharacterized protein n=1 Tax=Lecanosticta acicola TaxID=111012 RepID=A0AAI8Z5E3_9PEZI|nr:Hypothetical predicted protein [Lecanosticta acicola]